MSISTTQAQAIKAIVNLFETGHVLGSYGQVTVIPLDTGHLTFGRSQTTLGSGNLHRMINEYCGNPGSRFRIRLSQWLPGLEARDTDLDNDVKLHNVLRASADDPVMRDTQDTFFDATYFEPAVRAAVRFGISEPLGTAVVYDSFVHGSWNRIRDSVFGTPESRGERAWVSDYVAARRNWLASHSRADLRATVYRMDALQRLVDLGQWALELPLVVRGAEISSAALSARPPDCYEGPQPGIRPLAFLTGEPLCRGLDVRLVQLALSERGADIRADGVFGRATARCVSDFQQGQGMLVTGAVEPALGVQLASEVGAGVG